MNYCETCNFWDRDANECAGNVYPCSHPLLLYPTNHHGTAMRPDAVFTEQVEGYPIVTGPRFYCPHHSDGQPG
jgi:hypothetical protein